MERIKLGISTCLLGESVRYDGGHRLDRFLRDTIGQFATYIPVCPEVECGLKIPREAMQLEGDTENPRLVTVRTQKDYTDLMQNWSRDKVEELENKNLYGFIFKSKSPSCGMFGIKVYNDNCISEGNQIGIWARMFMKQFPLLPCEDSDRLHNMKLRENFIERIFVMKRWRDNLLKEGTLGNLKVFHTMNKLIIMSHSQKIYRELGKLISEGNLYPIDDLYLLYFELLNKAMKLKTTVKKNVAVLCHVMGLLNKQLSSGEKQDLIEIIDEYSRGDIPLIVPQTIINHYLRKYDQPNLKEQCYLNPHPLELKLRNHT